MKRISILFALLLATASVVNAQDAYHPLLKVGKVWNCYYTNFHYEYNMILTVEGDTIVDGDRCFKMSSKMVNQLTGEVLSEGSGSLFLEKDKKVYSRVISNVSNTWIWKLLYDFALNEGDERTLSDEQKQKVIADEQVYVMGRTFRRLKIEETLEEHDSLLRASGYWVEGVGSSHGLLNPCNWTFDGGSYRLVSCYEDGQCIFTSADFENMPSQQTNAVRSKLLREGREWWYHDIEAEFNLEAPYDFYMYVEGDTLINGLRWKKVYRKKTVPVYEKAMREQGSRVYELRPGGQERLLFDFSLKVGDSYEPQGEQGHKMTVIAVDTVMVDSVARRRLLLMQEVNGVMSDLTTWTEGIGSECGIDQTAYWSDMDPKVVEQMHSDNYYYLQFLGCKDYTKDEDGDYHPFLKDGKTWNCRLVEPVDENNNGYWLTTDYSLVLSGDTVVGDKTYKKMYRKPTMMVREYYKPAELAGKKDTLQVTGESTLWPELWREEGRKVYVYAMYAGIEGTELLRYDFSSLTPGQTVDICGIPTGILSIDTISLFEKDFRCFHVGLQGYPDSYDRVWIEGVGHPNGPFRVYGAEVNDGRQYTLFSCYEDGVCIYSAEEYEKTTLSVPNTQHLSPITQHPSALYDLQGRKVTGTVTRGIYVKNGKKVVVK